MGAMSGVREANLLARLKYREKPMKSSVSLSYLIAAALFGAMLAGAIAFPTAGAEEATSKPKTTTTEDNPGGCNVRNLDMAVFLVGYFLREPDTVPFTYRDYVDLTKTLGPQGVRVPTDVPLLFTTAVKFTLVPKAEVDLDPTKKLTEIPCRRHLLFIPRNSLSASSELKFDQKGKFFYLSPDPRGLIQFDDYFALYMDGSHVVSSAQRGVGSGTLGFESDIAVTDKAAQLIMGGFPSASSLSSTSSTKQSDSSKTTLTQPIMITISPNHENYNNTHVKATYDSKSYNGNNTDTHTFILPDKYTALKYEGTGRDGYWKAVDDHKDKKCSEGDYVTEVGGLYSLINDLAAKCGMRKVECNP